MTPTVAVREPDRRLFVERLRAGHPLLGAVMDSGAIPPDALRSLDVVVLTGSVPAGLAPVLSQLSAPLLRSVSAPSEVAAALAAGASASLPPTPEQTCPGARRSSSCTVRPSSSRWTVWTPSCRRPGAHGW